MTQTLLHSLTYGSLDAFINLDVTFFDLWVTGCLYQPFINTHLQLLSFLIFDLKICFLNLSPLLIISGGFYKFRVLAVYEDDDNKNSEHTPLFKLSLQKPPDTRVPDTQPTIVEAMPVIYKNKYGIGIKWHVRKGLVRVTSY